MKVTLINWTRDALETLIFTKNTRLRMSAFGLKEIKGWSEARKEEELEYMKGTIQSGFEFVDYMFLIEDVTRAFTHQLVRHRVGTSFAQQAQRAVDMSGFDYVATGDVADPSEGEEGFVYEIRSSNGDLLTRERDETHKGSQYDDIMYNISEGYQQLIALGVRGQDARGVLPTNICTNIVFKANLRTLHDMALKRLCVKAQGEFQEVFRRIKAEVLTVHPWAEPFIRVQCASSGTCIFPSLPVKECGIKANVYNGKTGRAYGGMNYVPMPVDDIQRWHDTHSVRDLQPKVAGQFTVKNDPLTITDK